MRRFMTTVMVPGLLLFLISCGGGEEGGAGAYGQGGEEETARYGGAAPVTLAGPVNNYGNGRADGRLDVKVDDLFFEPTFVEADPGAGITLTVRNNGKTRHSFTVTAQGLDETIEPGEVREIEVTAPSSDFIEFRCRFHADEGMRGAVYVSAAK